MSEQDQIDLSAQDEQASQQAEIDPIEQAAQQQDAEQQAEPQSTEQGEMESVMAGYNKKPAHQDQQEEAPAQAMRPDIGMSAEELTAKLAKVDELEEALNTRLQKVNNLVGNLKQRIDSLPKDAPKAEVRAITADSMKKLREFGYDELAEAIAEDLSGNFSVQTQQVDVGAAVKTALREISLQELTDIHPDWKGIVTVNEDGVYQHPGFTAWFNTLPEDQKAKVRTTESSAYASRVLDSYKRWEKEKVDLEAKARKASESRLKNAVTPTQGKAASTPSRLPDEAGLWAGYNKGPKPFNTR